MPTTFMVKRQLGEIDQRIRYLDKRISTMQVVDRLPSDTGKVYFGAWVELRHRETCDSYTYRIVGPDEIDQDPAYISIDSPMAKALIGKSEGDDISILQTTQNSKVLSFEKTPDPTEYKITAIRYALG